MNSSNHQQSTRLKNSIKDIYGSFYLAGNEFAISAIEIKEVVKELGDYNTIPLSPSYMVGMFNLRGKIVPVVDLCKIFYQNDVYPDYPDNKVIAIIEYGEFCVGIIFDKTGEIFHEKSDERVDFCPHQERYHDTIISGVFKLNNGQRIIQIIDPIEVINLEKLPRIQTNVNYKPKEAGRLLHKCISFKLGDSLCAIQVTAIREVLEIDKLENSVLAGKNCVGAINIRGDIVPIIDFKAFLGCEEVDTKYDENISHTVIVIKVDNSFFGLLVSSLDNIISYYDEDIIKFPYLGKHKAKMFIGCLPCQDKREVTLLSHNEIFSDNEIRDIINDHGKLFKEHGNVELKQVNTEFIKKTYITFSIIDSYALDISLVNEVMDYQDDIICPPGLPENVKGVINIRDELITIIDARALYNLPSVGDLSESKILVFIEGNTKYGLMVDSIDSIFSFTSDQAMTMPAFANSKTAKKSAVGIKNAIQIEKSDKTKATLLEIDIHYIIEKIGASEQSPLAIPHLNKNSTEPLSDPSTD